MHNNQTQTSIYLKQWNKGDKNGLNALLERHLPWIRSQASKKIGPMLRNKAETCDYVQDAMIQFLQYAPRIQLSDENHFRALILRIIQNTLNNKYEWYCARRRDMARERPLPNSTILNLDQQHVDRKTPSQVSSDHEEEAFIRLAMELLKPSDSEIIILRQWDKLSYVEIGEKLELTPAAARKRNDRAVLRLADTVFALQKGDLNSALDQHDPES